MGRGRKRRRRRGSSVISPPVRRLRARARRRSIRAPLPAIQRRVLRSPGFDDSLAMADRARASSSAVSSAKSLSAILSTSLHDRIKIASVTAVSPLDVPASPKVDGIVGFLCLGRSRILVAAGSMLREERIEQSIKGGEVFFALHEQRAQCPMHVFTRTHVDVLERLCCVDQPARVDVQARTAQQPSEGDQVVQEERHVTCGRSVRRGRRRERLRCLLGFQQRSQRVLREINIEHLAIERSERGDPVEGLGDARNLIQVVAS